MKEKKNFVCESCGQEYSAFQGKCRSCKEWNTIKEFHIPKMTSKNKVANAINKAQNQKWVETTSELKKLNEYGNDNGKAERKIKTGKSELDRVLGGGITQGSVILLSGSPGAGKSTLLIEVLSFISQKESDVLYVSGEESGNQILSRAKRLDLNIEDVYLYSETEVNKIVEKTIALNPAVVVIDSIQTIYNAESDYTNGSAAALKENTTIINKISKLTNIPFIIIGHVNKDGDVAGPKVLEHVVDVIANIDDEIGSEYRIIRASKNRYGNTDEVGVFEMTAQGMVSVDNPSALFVSEDRKEVSGTSILSTVEGTRPLLIEIQALVSQSEFNYPKRTSSGVNLNKLQMIIAILSNHTGITLNDQDVYVSAVGGIKITDPGIDLPLCISIASSYLKNSFDDEIVFFGEVDLTGRLRPVQYAEKRIKEASQRGFKRIIVPEKNVPKDVSQYNIEIIGLKNIGQVLSMIK